MSSKNKFHIWMLNCHIENKFEIEGFSFGFQSFCPNIITKFP